MKSKLRKWLGLEVAVEYKSCLYFFCLLTFYCAYLLWEGIYEANILFMVEMVLSAYFMAYFQVLALQNFDEAERLGGEGVARIFLCTGIYTALSVIFRWFDGKRLVTLLFFCFLLICYFSLYLANKVKRKVDTENLNRMLTEYKKGERHGKGY